VCDRALTFAEPKGPWMAVRALLEWHRTGQRDHPAAAARPEQPGEAPSADSLPGEPENVLSEKSATACFQWGLLCSSRGRDARAIEWLQHAVWLDWSNFWYQFYLAYLEDRAGLPDDALDHYSAAVVRQPNSAWVRFNRARLYRAKGRWTWALEDLQKARRLMGDSPDSLQVGLEIGVLHQALGNFTMAADEYRAIIAGGPATEYARAARLNLANIDAESGREPQALSAYESLLSEQPKDASTRFSRALLKLRLDQPASAVLDLDRLIQDRVEVSRYRPGEVLATRAVARLLLGQNTGAADDASEALQRWPCPANERLRQRALLAARRYDELELERPEEIRLFPVAGPRLAADLRDAAAALGESSRRPNPANYRGLLNRAVILSALGEHGSALQTADAVVAMAPLSVQGRLITARVLRQAGDPKAALSEVEAGRKLWPDESGLLELRGILLADGGQTESGLAALDMAITRGPHPLAYAAKAEILVRSKEYDRAVYQWSLALQHDPTLPQAYLGRARCYVELRLWERALADLEQAAAWANGDLRLQASILSTYARCQREHPEFSNRFWLLAVRTAGQAWNQMTRGSVAQNHLP
jgi:tetratricopeptide (TPR) repeat protein